MDNDLIKSGTGGFMNPESILREIDVKVGNKVADFGSGAGYFTIPLARAVGDEGKVWAIDVLRSALDIIESKAKLERLFNIETIRGNLEMPGGSRLKEKSADIVLLSNILFQSRKHSEILKEAKRVLKDDGRLVIIDWIPERCHLLGPGQPGAGWPLSQELAEKEAEGVGFKLERKFSAGAYHYGLIFKK